MKGWSYTCVNVLQTQLRYNLGSPISQGPCWTPSWWCQQTGALVRLRRNGFGNGASRRMNTCTRRVSALESSNLGIFTGLTRIWGPMHEGFLQPAALMHTESFSGGQNAINRPKNRSDAKVGLCPHRLLRQSHRVLQLVFGHVKVGDTRSLAAPRVKERFKTCRRPRTLRARVKGLGFCPPPKPWSSRWPAHVVHRLRFRVEVPLLPIRPGMTSSCRPPLHPNRTPTLHL